MPKNEGKKGVFAIGKNSLLLLPMISGKLRSRRFLAVSRILPSGAEAPVKKANRIRRSAPSGMTDERGDSRRRRNVRIPSGKFGSVPEEIPAWVLARKPRDKGSGGRNEKRAKGAGNGPFLLSGQKGGSFSRFGMGSRASGKSGPCFAARRPGNETIRSGKWMKERRIPCQGIRMKNSP
ncbi:MAG: hypothetical protein C6W57_05580 [Caldibacillus debilis]|nr:MAG: hypothetical protein C6W57_05580 [Caldibacillus debilis]